MPASLYLHVPFCPQICPYCDFHKMLRGDGRNEGLVERYLERLEREIGETAERYPGPLETIYLGGGTPSALRDGELARVVSAVDSAWGFPATLETTLEADPLTFDAARLHSFKELGFSRLSIGLQSTQDHVLKRLGRQHDARDGLEAVTWALEAGFEASADLITAVPEQDTERDLRTLAKTGVPHVSVYTLTIEPFTPFARRGVKVDEERAADDYELTNAVLTEYGLERYEVSSHARPGHESRHNQVYWHGRHFLGLGPSAAGFLPRPGLPGARVTNPPIKGWLRRETPLLEPVSPADYLLERLMTGLRTVAGVDLADVHSRSGIDIEERFAGTLAPLYRHDLLEVDSGRLRATPDGLIRLDAVLREFFAFKPSHCPGSPRGDADQG
ncbi:MAG: radical SAM family heme chaperone HemW [Trueperaceae bacterium]